MEEKNIITIDALRVVTKWAEIDASGKNNIPILTQQLIEVELMYFSQVDVFDKNDYPKPPTVDLLSIRKNVQLNFPELSYYNVPSDVSRKIAETEIIIGDAVEDLSEIIKDFYEFIWLSENTSIDNAIWHFRFGYKAHWGKHMNDLLFYLFNQQYEL